MAQENAIIDEELNLEENESESFDFDELEAKLQQQLEGEFSDLSFLQDESEKINNPDTLGDVIQGVVWEQFVNQIAAVAGEDFIEENRGLTLDLSKDAHIQTTENFAEGKIATHNSEIDYQQRHDDWQSNFQKEKGPDGKETVVTHETRTGQREATLVKGARAPFDKDRPKGSAEKHTDMDHTVSAAEIIRDPAANAHMTKDEQIGFANSEANLNEMDSSLNRSKGDKSMSDWLDNPNSKGQKPNEIFDISPEEEAKLRQKDAEAREEFERLKKEAEERSIESGKRTRRAEAKRIGGKTVRAVIMTLLAALIKEIIAKLVKWLKSANKALKTLLASLKEAIVSFVHKLKTHLMNAADSALTTIFGAIWGPVFNTIKKVWMMMKQGYAAVKQAIHYLRSPENKGKPKGILYMEVGKILMAGYSAAGAIVLSELIEKGLMAIPVAGAFFSFEIPLLGTLGNLLGIFFGAVVAGIIGALVINLIQKQISEIQSSENRAAKIDKSSEILRTQRELQIIKEEKLSHTKATAEKSISERHIAAAEVISESFKTIAENCTDDAVDEKLSGIDDLLSELEDDE